MLVDKIKEMFDKQKSIQTPTISKEEMVEFIFKKMNSKGSLKRTRKIS